jgi:hypothetical protein
MFVKPHLEIHSFSRYSSSVVQYDVVQLDHVETREFFVQVPYAGNLWTV